MQVLLDRIIRRTVSQLERDEVLVQDTEQLYFDLSEAEASEVDVQGTFNAASVCYRNAIGATAGQNA